MVVTESETNKPEEKKGRATPAVYCGYSPAIIAVRVKREGDKSDYKNKR